eukprot:1345701-Amorphochlora_amoeboformis.AAC.1
MLDARGYLKLVDFGFAKQIGPLDRAYTRCGTPDYQAPEIIEGKGYGLGVDWYCMLKSVCALTQVLTLP